MSVFYDFKKRLALEVGRVLDQRVAVADLIVSAPRPSTSGESLLNTYIEVTCGEITRGVFYDRKPIAKLFEGTGLVDYRVVMIDGVDSVHGMLGLVNQKFATNFTEDDLTNFQFEATTNILMLEATPFSYAYTGSYALPMTPLVVGDLVPTPLHDFRFEGDAKNYGTAAVDMTIPFTYVQKGGMSIAYIPAGSGALLFGNGLEFPVSGAYTIDFYINFPASVPTYVGMMLTNPAAQEQTGDFYYYYTRFYQYGVTPSGNINSTNPGTTPDVPQRITIVSDGTDIKLYIDMVQYMTYKTNNGGAKLKAFYQQWRLNYGLGRFRYWSFGLSTEELQRLFTGGLNIRPPLYKYEFKGGLLNSGGRSNKAINLPVASTRTDETGSYVKLSQKSGIDLGLSLPIATDHTLSFKIKLTGTPNYRTLFSNSKTAQAQTGTIMFESNNRIYQAGLGYGGSVLTPNMSLNKVYNITFRSIAGTIEIYIDGKKVHSYANPGNLAPLQFLGDGNTFSDQWALDNELGEISYWEYALTDLELSRLFKAEAPAPQYNYPYAADFVNRGVAAAPDSTQMSIVTFLNKNWAKPVGAYGLLGAQLPVHGDYTLMFEGIVNDIGDNYGMLLKYSADAAFATGDFLTWRNIAPGFMNRPTITGVGYSSYADCLCPPFVNDVPYKLMLIKKGNTFKMYKDGTLYWTFTGTIAAGRPWRVWGGIARSKQYIRNLSFWDVALEGVELQAAIAKYLP